MAETLQTLQQRVAWRREELKNAERELDRACVEYAAGTGHKRRDIARLRFHSGRVLDAGFQLRQTQRLFALAVAADRAGKGIPAGSMTPNEVILAKIMTTAGK